MMRSLPTIKFPGDLDWGTWIHRWDRMQDRYILRRRERFELMLGLIAETQKSVSRVLDLGCGTGSLLLRIAERFSRAEVYGVDFDLTLLALAERRLDKFGDRVGLIEADFRDPSWVKLVPNCMNAVVSTTALHWLSPEQLARLYGQLGEIIRPGGIFLNADHVRSDCENIQRVWERNREQMCRLEGDISADDWEGFWDAYGRALKMDIKKFRKELTEPWEGSEEGLPLGWHFERLKASGFEAADCFWRLDCDAVYGGIRR